MDVHLKELFGSFQQQFGTNGGNGRFAAGSSPPLFPDCVLTKIDGVSTAFIKSLFRACSALYFSNPWQRFRPQHLFGVSVYGSKPLFSCAHFVGNYVGDPALFLYRSEEDAISCLPTSAPHTAPCLKSIPSAGIFRLTFTSEASLPPPYKRMMKNLSVEVVGAKAFPFIDIIYPSVSINGGGFDATPCYNTPSLAELRWLFACVKAMTQVHPLLQQRDSKGLRRHGAVFEEFSQSVDVQWPAEDAKFWEATSVRILHPPREVLEHPKSPLPTDTNGSMTDVDLNGWLVPRQCAVCSKEVSAEMAPRCSRCKAVIYCGHVCQKQHWKEQHKGSCEVYKAMMEREEELELKGFNFSCLMEQPCKWQELVGVHGKGMWRRMCVCFKEHDFGLLPMYASQSGEEDEAWGLRMGLYPSDTPLLDHLGAGESASMVLLSGWTEYYNIRGLSLSSPVAALLSFPLSLYHIVTALNVATKTSLIKGKEVVVHYLGPEGELDWIPAFSELSHLLGSSGSLHIIMIGPEVPYPLSGATTSAGRKLKLTFVKGLYQEEFDSLPSPQVVVALNAGLESFASWAGALEVVKAQNVAAYFTDFSEPCCANAKQVLRAAGLQISYPVTPNPFRSPVRTQKPTSNIPWYSNGFVFGVTS